MVSLLLRTFVHRRMSRFCVNFQFRVLQWRFEASEIRISRHKIEVRSRKGERQQNFGAFAAGDPSFQIRTPSILAVPGLPRKAGVAYRAASQVARPRQEIHAGISLEGREAMANHFRSSRLLESKLRPPVGKRSLWELSQRESHADLVRISAILFWRTHERSSDLFEV